MCFIIDDKAERPRQRRAWKVVVLHEWGMVRSYMARYEWQTGEHRIRDDALTTRSTLVFDRDTGLPREGTKAREGFYVYLNKRDALMRCHPRRGRAVLLTVCVRPEDWIASSHAPHEHSFTRGRVATYRRVWVSEQQPMIEWY